jgi:Carboxypeptidase regulatory-like domain/TonB dependent receptor-like, beta-barrel
MTRASGLAASALIGGLSVLATPAIVSAQSAGDFTGQPVARVASAAPGSLFGRVEDEKGSPIAGVIVSALGATTTFALSDRDGRFEFGTLAPGPYMLRAHLTGFVAPRAQMVQVRASARTTSSISLRRAGSTPVLAAGLGGPIEIGDRSGDRAEEAPPSAADPSGSAVDAPDSHTETAWRLRHARRSILKDASLPFDLVDETDHPGGVTPVDLLSRAVGPPARIATSFFSETPFSGQLNLLTTGSFNLPQQLFSADSAPRNVAYVRVGAPVGERGDWTMRGALTQTDMSSWIVAGSYATRAPARHRYDAGMSYSTQRYDDGSPLSRSDFPDGTRSAGTLYAFDSFSVSPAVTLTYGTSYSRYDYLDERSLLSPRVELTVSAVGNFRITAQASRRALAPGAEEFLPPAETGIWMPAQRTFSALGPSDRFEAERTTHLGVGVERDFGISTLAFRAFSQHTADQLVALFGAQMPDEPGAPSGHYFVGNAGDAQATGCTAEFRTLIGGRVHGSIAYSLADAELRPGDLRYVVLLAPSSLRPTRETIHDVSTRIETNVPETSTRLLVLYRVSNAFARAAVDPAPGPRPALDSRFDVQVRQSLPFMNFSNARWEMLVAVRNFFRETSSDQSIYDELLVVRPPKRLVGGVTLHF